MKLRGKKAMHCVSDDAKPTIKILGQKNVDHPTPIIKNGLQTPTSRIRRQVTSVFDKKKLKGYLEPVLSHLECQEKAGPFLKLVDSKVRRLKNCNDIVMHPMDLSTIRKKLEAGEYQEPWAFIDDVWLMLDNAKKFNRKGTNAYRGAELLEKIFDEEINTVMQEKMKYCCGKRLFYTPAPVVCGAKHCFIPRESTYYNHKGQYNYCKKCFAAVTGTEAPVYNERQEVTGHVLKELFDIRRNDHLEPEPFVPCKDCGRHIHQICGMYLDHFWPDGFICENCRRPNFTPPVPLTAEMLIKSQLSHFIETRVSQYLITNKVDVKVSIRVLSSRERLAQLKPRMKARYPGRHGYPYRAKAIFAFLRLEGYDVAFFGMHVQEYGSDCPPPNHRSVYIGYLDSVQYFRPSELRTEVYREILLGYLDYLKKRGFLTVHIWACPPDDNEDDYIFHCHPPDQKIPNPDRLQIWYETILQKLKDDGIVIEFKDLHKYILDEGLQPVDDLPYFEGDFWPTILEDSLKEEEEETKRQANEVIASSGPATRAKRAKLSHYVVKDFQTKILELIKKHKKRFLVVTLTTKDTIMNLPLRETEDVDYLIYSDLMDGREGLLCVSLEKHYEFSSQRRATFSTMLLLFELVHSEDQNLFVCTNCNLHFTKGFRCLECKSESSSVDICSACHDTESHNHDMKQIQTKTNHPSQAKRIRLCQAVSHGIGHAVVCTDSACHRTICLQYKKTLNHANKCPLRDKEECNECKSLLNTLKAHAKYCTTMGCSVSCCTQYKMDFRLQGNKRQFQHTRCLQRRVKTMLQLKSSQDTENSETSKLADDAQPAEIG